MPSDPPRRPERGHADDAEVDAGVTDEGVYVVDTRRSRSRRPAPPPDRPTPDERSPHKASGGDPDDEVYVVDTRRKQSQPRRPAAAAPAPGERHTSPAVDGPPRTRIRKGRVVLLTVVLVVVAWLAFMVWVPVNAWNSVARVDNIPAGARPADTSGHNYLLVGSDSRAGLTKAQRKEYATGNAEGQRTDTIMLVHVSESGGKPVMVSIPRDSYVPIPGYGSNKINASFSLGGPKLLTRTVEQVTGIHVDGYLEIGLGGFAAVVDSLGGVDICVPRNMTDKKAGIDLKKGCQTLDGKDALGYVRSRYEDPLGDIGRAARQRQFLGALMKQAATPATVLVPWRYKGFADAVAGGLAVGEGTSLMDAVRILRAMRSVSNDEGLSLSVPIESMAYPTSNAGVAVKWDTDRAKALFRALKNDEPLTAPPPGTTVKD
ncbi:LCP family protein [Intrasporangium sp.]|uniref:LCP family protein n=1 Tax=Intrasporangium sp. TaxID=1925024 RepID=UPI0032216B3C